MTQWTLKGDSEDGLEYMSTRQWLKSGTRETRSVNGVLSVGGHLPTVTTTLGACGLGTGVSVRGGDDGLGGEGLLGSSGARLCDGQNVLPETF